MSINFTLTKLLIKKSIVSQIICKLGCVDYRRSIQGDREALEIQDAFKYFTAVDVKGFGGLEVFFSLKLQIFDPVRRQSLKYVVSFLNLKHIRRRKKKRYSRSKTTNHFEIREYFDRLNYLTSSHFPFLNDNFGRSENTQQRLVVISYLSHICYLNCFANFQFQSEEWSNLIS